MAGIICILVSMVMADFGPVENLVEIDERVGDHTALTYDSQGNVYYFVMREFESTLYIKTVSGVIARTVYTNSIPPMENYKPDLLVEDDQTIHIAIPGNYTGYKVSHDMGVTFENTYVECASDHPKLAVIGDEVTLICNNSVTYKKTAYQLFVDVNKYPDDYPALFWGPDVYWGPVHSNDDIWIMQGGGGSNNEWPTFHQKVTTAGEFRLYPSGGTIPPGIMPDIFLGGYEDNHPSIPFDLTASGIRENGNHPFNDPSIDIVYVKLSGSNWISMIGRITETYQDIPVYSWFPQDAAQAQGVINGGGNWFEEANIVHTNHIAVRDTIWVSGPSGSVSGNSVFVDYGKLWIEGVVSGMISFGCADSVIITGDLTYAGTAVGQAPDGDNFNAADMLGIISEKSIIVGYKNYNPWTGIINDANCDGVYLYGAFAATGLGDTLVYGNMASHYDGVFTFEYQHPHGSTPDFIGLSPYTLQDTLYTLVDFYRNIFPVSNAVIPEVIGFNLHGGQPQFGYPCCGYPYTDPAYLASYPNTNPASYAYPGGTDWPYYNPVWPESSDDIVFERGTLHTWASIIQRRRGFIHRSGTDPYNHSAEGEWDIANQHFDGTHSPTGYNPDYHYDNRMKEISPPDFTYYSGTTTSAVHIYHSNGIVPQFTSVFQQDFEADKNSQMQVAQDGNMIAVVVTNEMLDCILMVSHDGGLSFSSEQLINPLFDELEQVAIGEGIIYGFDDDTQSFYQLNEDGTSSLLAGQEPQPLYDLYSTDMIAANNTVLEGRIIWDGWQSYSLGFKYLSPEYYFYDQTIDLPDMAPCHNVTINDIPGDDITLYFSHGGYMSGMRKVYQTTGTLPDFTGAYTLPSPDEIILSNHPNPFNPTTEICFSISSEQDKPVAIEIFNVRGQKVRKLEMKNDELEIGSVTWDGTDSANRPVASGVYLYRLVVDNKPVAQKKMMMIK